MIIIRKFQNNDTQAVIDLIIHYHSKITLKTLTTADCSDLQNIYEKYICSGGGFWVAEDNNRVIGTIGLKRYSITEGILKKFFVYENYHGTSYHVGYSLFKRLIHFANDANIFTIFLYTPSSAEKALRFYNRVGFKKIDKNAHKVFNNVPDNFSCFSLNLQSKCISDDTKY